MGANLIIALMVSVACAVSCNPVLSACPTQRWVWPTVRLNLRLRGGVQAEEGDECAGNSDLFQRLGFDDYVSKELADSGLLPALDDNSDDVDDVQRLNSQDETEDAAALRRAELAAKLPANASAEEVAAWHQSFNEPVPKKSIDKEQQLQEEEQAQRDFEEEVSCCGEGPWSRLKDRYNGSTYRDPDMFRANESDLDFWRRYGEGHLYNKTLKGLYELKLAATYNDCESIERLVKRHGVDASGFCDEISREQAIHFTAFNGHIESSMLLLDLGADPNCCNIKKQTPLHRAAFGGFLELCELLIERGAQAVPLLEDDYGFTAPEWAAYNDHNQNEVIGLVPVSYFLPNLHCCISALLQSEEEEGQTCQWFYAKFVHDNGKGFPLGDPPFYGLPQDAGSSHYHPWEHDEENMTVGLFNHMHIGEDRTMTEKGLLRHIQEDLLHEQQAIELERATEQS